MFAALAIANHETTYLLEHAGSIEKGLCVVNGAASRRMSDALLKEPTQYA